MRQKEYHMKIVDWNHAISQNKEIQAHWANYELKVPCKNLRKNITEGKCAPHTKKLFIQTFPFMCWFLAETE